MIFVETDPNENFQVRRFVSEHNWYEMGLTQMLFGRRVCGNRVGDCGYDFEYCAGADPTFQLMLLATMLEIMGTFEEGFHPQELRKILPGYKVRPIMYDPCWPALLKLSNERLAMVKGEMVA